MKKFLSLFCIVALMVMPLTAMANELDMTAYIGNVRFSQNRNDSGEIGLVLTEHIINDGYGRFMLETTVGSPTASIIDLTLASSSNGVLLYLDGMESTYYIDNGEFEDFLGMIADYAADAGISKSVTKQIRKLEVDDLVSQIQGLAGELQGLEGTVPPMNMNNSKQLLSQLFNLDFSRSADEKVVTVMGHEASLKCYSASIGIGTIWNNLDKIMRDSIILVPVWELICSSLLKETGSSSVESLLNMIGADATLDLDLWLSDDGQAGSAIGSFTLYEVNNRKKSASLSFTIEGSAWLPVDSPEKGAGLTMYLGDQQVATISLAANELTDGTVLLFQLGVDVNDKDFTLGLQADYSDGSTDDRYLHGKCEVTMDDEEIASIQMRYDGTHTQTGRKTRDDGSVLLRVNVMDYTGAFSMDVGTAFAVPDEMSFTWLDTKPSAYLSDVFENETVRAAALADLRKVGFKALSAVLTLPSVYNMIAGFFS